MNRLAVLACIWLWTALPLQAQTPEEIIRWLYTSMTQPGPAEATGLDFLASPAQRSTYFSRRMVAFYDANDSYGDDLAQACIDFSFAVPGNAGIDNAELLRTLSVSASGDGGRKSVLARFTNFGSPAEITYEFIVEEGFWRIDDVAGPGWRASQIPCSPKQASVPAPGNAFCYQTEADSFRLDVAADGSAWFQLSSWQANGHMCSGDGIAQPMQGGWLFQGEGACQLQIRVAADQGLQLLDPDWACKPAMCGQRAVLDGLTFPRSRQIDCAGWSAR